MEDTLGDDALALFRRQVRLLRPQAGIHKRAHLSVQTHGLGETRGRRHLPVDLRLEGIGCLCVTGGVHGAVVKVTSVAPVGNPGFGGRGCSTGSNCSLRKTKNPRREGRGLQRDGTRARAAYSLAAAAPPVAIAVPPVTVTFSMIAARIFSAISGFSVRNAFAASRPWPMRLPS